METLNKSAGAETWKQIFKEAVKDGGRNAGVAGVQTIFENGVAKNIYDPNRGYLDNIEQRMLAAGITGAALKGGLEIIAKVRTGKNPTTLSETQKIFNVEPKAKSQVELNAKQIENRNSGNDVKDKLNRKLDAGQNKVGQSANNSAKIKKSETLSDESLRTEFRNNLYEYNQYAREIEDLKLKHPEVKDIPTEDLVAIKAYSAEHYEWLNEALRTDNKASLKKFKAHIICATSGLNQLPDYKGVVVKGTDLTTKQSEVYKVGEIVTEKGFGSSSYAEASAFKGNTQFTISSKTGKKIDFLSNYPYEREILFRPGTKFKVLSNDVDPKTQIRKIRIIEVEDNGGVK